MHGHDINAMTRTYSDRVDYVAYLIKPMAICLVRVSVMVIASSLQLRNTTLASHYRVPSALESRGPRKKILASRQHSKDRKVIFSRALISKRWTAANHLLDAPEACTGLSQPFQSYQSA